MEDKKANRMIGNSERVQLICKSCHKHFFVKKGSLEKYPGWTPKQCLSCKDAERDYEDSDELLWHPGHPDYYGDN